jgi:uncharacterized protein YegL
MKTLFAFLLLALGMVSSRAADDLAQEYQSQSATVIHIVFDDSGSMAGIKMQQAKKAFTKWLSSIPEETKLSLTALNAGLIVDIGANNRSAVTQAVEGLKASGGTPLGRTCKTIGQKIIQRRAATPYERHIMVVFTDGQDSESTREVVGQVMQSIARASIETVGIGFHGEGDYLRQDTGQYFNASDEKELVAALSQVGSEIDSQSELVISQEIAARMENKTADISPASTSATPTATPSKKGLLQRLFGF